jgi:Holliday junction resolvasome RuvABC endonuclease subunit
MILALDCATKTGWALIDKGKVVESGVQDFSKKRGESNGGMFLRFRKWLYSTVISDGITNDPFINLLVYEQAHHRGGAATEVCVNLTGRVQEIAAQSGIEVATYHTASLKKWATGKGKGDKGAMIAEAEKRTGKIMQDDNEADAILLGLMAWEEYGI